MGDSGPREACESAATAMVPLLLLLVTAHALVLPDVVEDVADAVQVQIPVANASASLQGRTVALGFEVGAHLALHARLPTALAENPAWLPDTEQIQEFSPKQAGQRLGFFVSAHVIAWILLCLIGTTIMTRCCGTCTDPSGYESVAPLQSGDESGDGTDPSGYESVTSAARPLVYGDDVWRAFFGTYLISLVAVFASLRFNRLSKATGLDFEVYLVLFVLQGTRLLGQAVTATRSLGPARRFPIDTFTVGAVAATMPFMADSFDTLKDVVFGALCIMSDSWELRLAGFASLVWLPCVHYMLLRVDIECLADLSGSYFPFASAQPANDESDESEAAEGEGCCWPKVEKSLHELYKQTTPGKIRLLLWEAGPQGVFALLYVILEGGSKFVTLMQLAAPLLQAAFGWLCNEQLGRWTMRSTGKRLAGAFSSGNLPLQTSLLGTILRAEEELRETALAEARKGIMNVIKPEVLSKTTWSMEDLRACIPLAFGEIILLSKTVITIYIGCADLGDEGAKALAGALGKNVTVAHIDLGYNSIGDEGAKALAGALEKNATVAHIGLAGALEKNATVAHIDLGYNSIGDEGAKALAGALEKNATVAHIDLGHNYIGVQGAKALAGTLEKNATVAHIELSGNSIGVEGANALAGALEKNATVAHIDLGSNSIGDEGAKALGGALEKNATVTHIDLGYNSIGDEGAKALAGALEKNATVTNISLIVNSIGFGGFTAEKRIFNIVARNKAQATQNSQDGAGSQ